MKKFYKIDACPEKNLGVAKAILFILAKMLSNLSLRLCCSRQISQIVFFNIQNFLLRSKIYPKCPSTTGSRGKARDLLLEVPLQIGTSNQDDQGKTRPTQGAPICICSRDQGSMGNTRNLLIVVRFVWAPEPKVTTSVLLRVSSSTQGNARDVPREFLLGSSIKGRQGQARDLLQELHFKWGRAARITKERLETYPKCSTSRRLWKLG